MAQRPHSYGEMTYAEIGKVLGMTEEAVRMLVLRAFKKLRQRGQLGTLLQTAAMLDKERNRNNGAVGTEREFI